MSRLTLALVRVVCDTEGCTASYPPSDWASDMSVAWREARRAGWERDYEQHRCPGHALNARPVALIRQLASTGMPDGRIGERVGLTRSQVQYLRSAHGIEGRRPGRPATLTADRLVGSSG